MAHNVANKIGVKPAWYRLQIELHCTVVDHFVSMQFEMRTATNERNATDNEKGATSSEVHLSISIGKVDDSVFPVTFLLLRFSCYEKNHEIVQKCELWIICEILEIIKTKNNLRRWNVSKKLWILDLNCNAFLIPI